MTYSIQKIVKKYSNTDWIKIIDGLNREIRNLMNVRKQTEDQVEYIRTAEKILFVLQSGNKPIGIDNDDFLLLKPLIQSLVDKGQLESEIISIFD